MSSHHLDLQAQSSEELLAKLAAIDIAVPPYDEKRPTPLRERYMAARLLSTLASTNLIKFPMRLEHGDKPDFGLHSPTEKIGIECVEATHEEWAQIQAIRDQDYPEALVFLPMLRPGKNSFTLEQKLEIAQGKKAGPPWVGKMAEKQWAEAMVDVIAKKTKKLRNGNYSDFTSNWLLIQDEWPVPLYQLEKKMAAASLCLNAAGPYLDEHCFSNIFIGDSTALIHLKRDGVKAYEMVDLWK